MSECLGKAVPQMLDSLLACGQFCLSTLVKHIPPKQEVCAFALQKCTLPRRCVFGRNGQFGLFSCLTSRDTFRYLAVECNLRPRVSTTKICPCSAIRQSNCNLRPASIRLPSFGKSRAPQNSLCMWIQRPPLVYFTSTRR